MPILCNWRKLWRAAEIGVDRGEFALTFLERWQGEEYWAIDAYEPYPEMPFPREADYLMAVARLERHARRAKIMRLTSIEASRMFKTDSLDFIYIDGAHDYASVKADVQAWFPKLSDHGILAGHDWTDQGVHEGVKRAVSEFAVQLGLTIYLTSPIEGYLPEECPSWYAYKSGVPDFDWRRC